MINKYNYNVYLQELEKNSVIQFYIVYTKQMCDYSEAMSP